MKHLYLIALGSNMRHRRFGLPEQVLGAALAELGQRGIGLLASGPVMRTKPVGPSRRRYANSAALVNWKGSPEELLRVLKDVERSFGRRTGGQRWTARVLDLDIVLWRGGMWASADLTVPHVMFRDRDFVLKPAMAVAADWRDPVTGLTLRQLAVRLARPVRNQS